jgi:TP901 family phage tail tape measure protein
MSQSIQLPVTQVGLEQSIAAAMKRVGNSTQINLGTSSKQINALSQPLGRITGQADEFSKSMAAANARVLAFGASAGIIAGVSSAMVGLVSSTIKVEKSLVEINSVLNKSSAELDKFGQDIFNVAKNTGKSFDEVANGALELARQGLDAEDTLIRLNDALILSRLSGLDAAQSVEGLTAAFNSFQSSGITTAEILNKVVAVSQKFAVSEKDLIEGIKRSASVAQQAGVSFDELAALITAVQERTARGGAVIGNSFKTIFARIQRKDVLTDLQDLGVQVTDLEGNILPALKVLQNLAGQLDNFSQIEQASIAEKLGGVFQLDKLLASLKDLSSESSVTAEALKEAAGAGNSAYEKNIILNTTLAALINKVAVNAEQLGAKLGEIGVTDSLKNVLGFFNSLLEGIQKVLGEESGLGNLVRGLVKGLGNFLAGPGLVLFGGIILKLSKDLVQFGFASLKTFFGIGKAAKEVQSIEGAISQILARNVDLQQQLFAKEGNRAAQLKIITSALIEQEAILRRSSAISAGLAAPLYNVGGRATDSGLRLGGGKSAGNSAGGYMPAVAKESAAIKQGVGGARSGDKPVVIPNFNFGGGKKGTMVAHSGEYIVPNFNGSGGSAVFNRRMVQSMGLPSGAKKIGAAGGFVPNFAGRPKLSGEAAGSGAATFLKQFNLSGNETPEDVVAKINQSGNYLANIVGKSIKVNDLKGNAAVKDININSTLPSAMSTISKQSKGLYYNSNNEPAALMLVPENRRFNPNELNTKFAKQRPESGLVFDGFIGGIAGINPNPNDKKFSSLTNIDNEIAEALSTSAVNILKNFDGSIKIEPKSNLSPNSILKSVLAEGGAGAYGAFKGALFESVIKLVSKGKGQEDGTLDVDFNQGRDALEAIFGLQGKKYRYADFKNSSGQKDKFISQVMKNLSATQYPKKAQKGMSAAGGYIPNFAKYIYDSDMLKGKETVIDEKTGKKITIPSTKAPILAKILASNKVKDLLISPAGAGKTTFAAGEGTFIRTMEDVDRANADPKGSFLILSAASRAKEGLSKQFQDIINSVNSSGGNVRYLYQKNLDILNQRKGRQALYGDLRGEEALKGTRYSAVNQYDFISKTKKASNEFSMFTPKIGAAGGYIPNFVSKSREIGSGAFGTFFRLGKNKEGTDVGVKKFKNYIPSRSIEAEWLTSEFVNKYANIPGVFGPKNLSSFEDSKRKKAIRKEVVSDSLARIALGSQKASDFGQKVLFAAFKARGLQIGDFHGSNYTLNKNAQDAISGMQNFPSDPVGAFSILRQIAASGGRIGAIDVGAAIVTDPARSVIGQIMARQASQKTAASGYIPNFANALKEAIGREMAAGVPASQIYVDKNSSLKNAMNPMGLMVANRRDEPVGGFQGINRAKKEGANPMMYGAAGGFVPNYAPMQSAPTMGTVVGGGSPASKKAAADLNKALSVYANQLKDGAITIDKVTAELAKIAPNAKKLTSAAQASAQKYAEELNIRQQAIANRVLESNAGKKIAKQLDKIYLEYNKSQKTAQDLRNAQAKAAAVLQKTSLRSGTQQAIVASTGSLASTRTSAQPGAGRDMLGTIFAVQGALSLLTGATDGASNSLAKYTNIVSSGIGSFATAAFAIQGVTQLGGSMGALATKLGPYGLAIAGTFAAFSIGGKIIDEYTKVNKYASDSMARLAEATQRAAVKLEDLSPTSQVKIGRSAKDLISNAARYETFTEGGLVREKVEFEGFDSFGFGTSPTEESLQNLVKASLAAGVAYEDMFNIINKKSEDGRISKEDVEDIQIELEKLTTSAENVKKAFSGLDLNIESGIGKTLVETNLKNNENLSGRSALINNAARADAINKLKEELKKTNPNLDINSPAALKLIDDQIKALDALAAAKKDDEAQKGKDFQVNLGRLQAEINLNKKLSDNKNAVFSTEQAQKESLAIIENDISLSENARLKAIAAINQGYGKSIALLNEQEQQAKNIGDALVSALTGVPGIVGDQIPVLVDAITSKGLPAFDGKDINEYQKQLQDALKSVVPDEAIKPLIEKLSDAVKLNKEVSDEREKQLTALEKEYGIEINKINATAKRLSDEKLISAEIESRNSGASFEIEKRVLNNAYESLSINKEIERIKRDTALNELQKAEEVYKLELKRKNLESTGIGIGLEQKILDIDQDLIGKARSAIKDSGMIASGGLRSDLTLEQLQNIAGADPGVLEEIKFAVENAKRQRELAQKEALNQQANLGDVVPDTIIDKVREGFSGGIGSGITGLQNQINTFAFDIGEKIPQMFSDNMSSAINKMIEGGESFGDVLQGAAYEFVKGINQANIQNLSNKFSNLLFGSDKTGGKSGIGSILGLASGGMITGGSGTKDDVPAMLMGGEYVVNKKAVSKYGAQFLESLNNGTLMGYAKGGSVQKGPQGNFYAPGTFGQGAISGKRDLLAFATQTGTSGKFDQMINESGYQSVSLEPESSQLSVFGMRNSPMFEATQSAKEQAFDLYLQQYNQEREAKKAEKEAKKAFRNQLIMAAASAIATPVIGAATSGFGAAFKGAAGQGIMSQLGAGFKGVFTGGNIGGTQVGGLGNLFSSVGKAFTGNFSGASNQFKLSQIGNVKQLTDLYKSDKSFASYFNSMGGFDTSGAPRAIEASGFGGGVFQSGNINKFAGGAEASDIAEAQRGLGITSDTELSTAKLNIFNKIFGGIGGVPSRIRNLFGGLGTGYGNGIFDEYGNYNEEAAAAWEKANGWGRATGGMIPSMSGIDTVPAMLSGGEFVMNRSAVQGIGASNLQSMNSGGTSITSEETSKELNEKLLAKLDELINASGSAGNITINVAPSGQTTQETSQDPSAGRQQLARQIKDAVLQIINDEKRIGGTLRR